MHLAESLRRAAVVGAALASIPALAGAQQPQQPPQPPAAARVFEEALTAARAIADQGDREEVLARIGEARARARDFTAARTALRNLRDAELRAEATENVALIAARMDRFPEAIEIARGLQDEGRRAQTLGRIAREHARAGDFAGAVRVAQDVAPLDAKVLTLAFISEIASRAGNIEVARATITDALATMDRIADRGLKDTMATIVAAARARAGDYNGALEVANRIVNIEARIGALVEIAAIAVASNARTAANDVALALIAIGRNVRSESDRVRLFVEAAQLKVRVGDTGAADALIREATAAVTRIDDEAERQDGQARVSAALVRGDSTAALAYARAITDRGGRDQSVAAVANALALTGRPNDALALVGEIGEQPFRDDALRRAVLAMAASDINRAIEAAQPAAPPLRNAIYVAMVEARSSAGDAAATLIAATKIVDVQVRDAALATAARTLARQHRSAEGARRVAERIELRELRDDVMVDVVDTEARDGNLPSAYAAARAIRAPASRAVALALVAARINRPATP